MSFSTDIKRFTDKTEYKIDRVIRMSFIEVATRIVRRSPVGDASFWKGSKPKGYTGGRFRANWQASINTPKTGTKKATNSSSATSSITAAARKKQARSYYLMNNLLYATALEKGHSRQARDGIVKLVAAEWKSIVRLMNKMVK